MYRIWLRSQPLQVGFQLVLREQAESVLAQGLAFQDADFHLRLAEHLTQAIACGVFRDGVDILLLGGFVGDAPRGQRNRQGGLQRRDARELRPR